MIKLRFAVNGAEVVLQCPPHRRLVDILRIDLGLTDTRESCGVGECGACLVLLDGKPVNSCLVPAFTLSDADVVTAEGLAADRSHAELKRLLEEDGPFRCGFCSSGFLVAAAGLKAGNPEPSRREVQRALSGNICRCAGYRQIVDAVWAAFRKGRYGQKR